MILEGIVTTKNADGAPNAAPMGPIVDESMTQLVLRPFCTSNTFRNLKRNPVGVFHVVDDVLLLAQAAIRALPKVPETFPAVKIDGAVLNECCRWHEFRIVEFDDSQERSRLTAEVVHCERKRDFFGFNRARHAVIEAAILATRVHLIDGEEILQQFRALRSPLEKTGGEREFSAFELLENYVREYADANNRDVLNENTEAPCSTSP